MITLGATVAIIAICIFSLMAFYLDMQELGPLD
jgi:hypothetical protein